MTAEIIAQLNDQFRHQENKNLGRFLKTSGVNELPVEKQAELLELVKNFDCFTNDNDPYGEHDFGKVTLDNQNYFWQIQYYDLDFTYGSEDPADPKVTRRVLTIMQTCEY